MSLAIPFLDEAGSVVPEGSGLDRAGTAFSAALTRMNDRPRVSGGGSPVHMDWTDVLIFGNEDEGRGEGPMAGESNGSISCSRSDSSRSSRRSSNSISSGGSITSHDQGYNGQPEHDEPQQHMHYTFPQTHSHQQQQQLSYALPHPLTQPQLQALVALPTTTADFDSAFRPRNEAEVAGSLPKNGGWRPVQPCSHCRRLRLQCFVIQTMPANPSPVKSCTSCAALFRQCSLAEKSKRLQSATTSHLQGISEIVGVANAVSWSSSRLTALAAPSGGVGGGGGAAASKRSSSRSVRKTQVLHDWYLRNAQHPYPTDEDKTALADRSGLSRTQVINWFTNARRHNRQSLRFAPSPMVTAMAMALTMAPPPPPPPLPFLCGMTPLERWRNTPPESDPASESALQRALAMTDGYGADGGQATGESTSVARLEGRFEPRTTSGSLPSPSPPSASSYPHLPTTHSESAWPAHGSNETTTAGSSTVKSSVPRARNVRAQSFPCGYCARSFSKKYDWLRHERSLHAPGDALWICAAPLSPNQSSVIWRVGQAHAECVFCGQAALTAEHVQSHDFESCAKRAVQDRSFSRKDHLWQHLYKFHGCRKWEGWKPDLYMLQHRV